MAGLSFGSSGATPSNGISNYLAGFGYKPTQTMGSTPQSSALNNAQVGPNRSVVPPQPATPSPSTAVKSTTVSHPDGTTIATTYHPPSESTPGLINPSTGKSNQQVLDDSTAAANTAKSVLASSQQTTGTQHPGDAGFTPITPKQTQSATAEYDANGQYAGTLPAGSTANNTVAGPTTFPGILGSLTSTAQNGSGTANIASAGLLNAPNQNAQISQQAQDIKNKYGGEIEKVSNYGNALAGSYQNGAGLAPVSQGLAGIAQNTTANEVQGIQAAENAELNPLDRELTAQNQGQAGLTSAANIGQTGQSLEQSGLTSAAGFAAPQQNYPFVFDPSTGTYKNASTGGVMNAADAAQSVLSGKLSYADAKSALGYLGGTGEAQLQSAIMQANPNANLNQLEAQAAGQQAVAGAPYSAQASNIGTAGTAEANTYNTIFNNAKTQAATYSQQQSAINGIGNQALSLLTQAGINPSSSQYANLKLNQLGSQFSSPQYAAFNAAIQALQARIGTALQAGEIPTAATSNAQAIANGNITLPALASTLKQIDNEMGTFVGTQNALADYAQKQLKNTTGGSGGSSSDPLGIR